MVSWYSLKRTSLREKKGFVLRPEKNFTAEKKVSWYAPKRTSPREINKVSCYAPKRTSPREKNKVSWDALKRTSPPEKKSFLVRTEKNFTAGKK